MFKTTPEKVDGAPEDAGIIPRAVVDIFKRVDELRTEGVKASVHASFLEVSRGELPLSGTDRCYRGMPIAPG